MRTIELIQESDALLRRLFPICRSITGDGVRETLKIVQEYCSDFQIVEYESGTQVYDWTIPKEWNIKDAYIKDSSGNRIVDFQKCNVHVVSYSTPILKKMKFEDLKTHLHTLPKLPDAIPYRTSYYKEDWGFCLSQNQYDQLDIDDEYEVCVDSTLNPGSLTLAEAILPGKRKEEILLSSYCCHPSLANDNLSGVVLTTLLVKELKKLDLEYTYRIVILPETIGAIAYLFHNEEKMKKVKGGFVITTVAGPGKFGYKQTFQENHEIDRVSRLTFREYGIDFVEYPFVPDGSDERQYSSPGFRIPVGTICKDKYYEYPYYHTSLDNLDFVKSENLIQTLQLYLSAIEKLEKNVVYKSLNPYCEAQLGKRGLYPQTGGSINQLMESNDSVPGEKKSFQLRYKDELDTILWILFYSDGENSILDIAEKIDTPFQQILELCNKLEKENLLESIE